MSHMPSDIIRDIDLIDVSHRNSFQYIEHARIEANDGRVIYWKHENIHNESMQAWSIPAFNTAVLLLGPGCSITTAAIDLLSAANVTVGFTGGQGSPLFMGIEQGVFATGQSEYRPTQYAQQWMRIWLDEGTRFEAAKKILNIRREITKNIWSKSIMDTYIKDKGIVFEDVASLDVKKEKKPPFKTMNPLEHARTTQELLGIEGQRVHALYHYFSTNYQIDFKRDQDAHDGVNGLLTAGNYIAYGLAASSLHAIGVPFSMPLLHGKTRRGALVFDIADPIKDAIIVPVAFAMMNKNQDEFRREIKRLSNELSVIKINIEMIKSIIFP